MDSMPPLPEPAVTLTHAKTAWLVLGVPAWLAVALILGMTLIGRHPLSMLFQALILRRLQRWRGTVDPGLIFEPRIVAPERLLLITAIVVASITALVSQLAPMLLVLMLSLPGTLLGVHVLIWWYERRYIGQLDAALPAVVGRLATHCASASSFPQAFDAILADMDESPLKQEWSFLKEHFGTPLALGTLALPHQVVGALIEQSPSERHRTFLGHLHVALQQPHDSMTRRLQAAARGLAESEQRRSAALTELSQMRYSGMAVGGAGIFMAIYLLLTQWERFLLAYQGIVGVVAGTVVVLALLAPIVGGFLLSQAEDMDY